MPGLLRYGAAPAKGVQETVLAAAAGDVVAVADGPAVPDAQADLHGVEQEHGKDGLLLYERERTNTTREFAQVERTIWSSSGVATIICTATSFNPPAL